MIFISILIGAVINSNIIDVDEILRHNFDIISSIQNFKEQI
jgi:hypothetical protein